MAVLKNRAKMSTSTTGTGTITLGSAESGYQTFGDAGVANADVVRYVIEDGTAWEIGTGTYTATGTTLTRTVSESSNADAAIVLTGSAVVFVGAAAEDIPALSLYAENPGTYTAPSATGSNDVAIGDGAVASGGQGAFVAGGYGNWATSGYSVSLGGANTRSTGSYTVSIGGSSNNVSGFGSIIAAFGGNVSGQYSTGLGKNVTVSHSNSVALGLDVTSTAANQVNIGGSTQTVRISETYTLPTADGTANQVLTTDGAGAVTFATAGGGGNPALYADNAVSATTPTASGNNAVAIGSGAEATNTDSVALGKAKATGEEAFSASIDAISTTYGAHGTNSIAIGRIARANGTNAVAIGQACIGTGTRSISVGYDNNVTQNVASSFGTGNTNSAASCITLGLENTAAHQYSMGFGFAGSTRAKGHHAQGFGYGLTDSAFGMGIYTPDATPKDLVGGFYNSAAGSDNQVILRDKTGVVFTGVIVAHSRETGSTDCAAWEVKGLIRRGTSASDTVLVTSAITVVSNTHGWVVALTADTSNGALKITVTGEAGAEIRWASTIKATEARY